MAQRLTGGRITPRGAGWRPDGPNPQGRTCAPPALRLRQRVGILSTFSRFLAACTRKRGAICQGMDDTP
ncbi:hypothetical protein Y886_36565 [Xanthomonas hyacinthi DSM 19077]|nr:hypothetical protein Y886_36565 [Xanthomonas hyacinthi DSM 19077]